MAIWTIGHSTRPIEDFIAVLKHYGIELLADVRTVPGSRKNPQFNSQELAKSLAAAGIEYVHLKNLGGLRKVRKDSPNTGWHNESFRAYADYMQTPEFEQALDELIELASRKRTAIMCAEALPWRCHRSLIADALLVRGVEVVEIFTETKAQAHKMTGFAVVRDGKVTYPDSSP